MRPDSGMVVLGRQESTDATLTISGHMGLADWTGLTVFPSVCLVQMQLS